VLQQAQAISLPRRAQLALFARNFLKHPRMLGSVIPSSRFLIRQVLRQVDWEQARVIVEYGPGVGTFTTEILARMRPDARLVVFETNEDFVQFLRSAISDPRLIVLHESAAEIGAVLSRHGLDQADYVISGIPFSTMPAAVRSSILRATREALRPGGAFLVYQFSGSVLTHLRREFGHVEHGFEPRNVLPARWFKCQVKAQPVVV
jgi:phospholipid N-methyltransferase